MVLCVRVPGLSIPLEFRLKMTASGAGPTLYDLHFAQRGGGQAGTGPERRRHAAETSARPTRAPAWCARCGHRGDDLTTC